MTAPALLLRPPVNIADYQDAVNYLASHGGGVLQLGPGDYTITQRLVLGNKVKLRGAGRGLTRLYIFHATEPCIDLGGGDVNAQEGGIADLTVKPTGTRNIGAAGILINGMGNGLIERVHVADNPCGLKALSTGVAECFFLRDFAASVSLPNDGIGIDINGANGIVGDQIMLQGSGAEDLSNPNAPYCGIRLVNSHSSRFIGLRAFHFKWGGAIVTSGAVAMTDFVKSIFEFNTNEGFEINASGSGRVERLFFDSCDFWYNGGRGLRIQSSAGAPALKGVDLDFCRVIANHQHGIYQTYGSGLSVQGGTICANGRAAANTYSGLVLGSGIGDAQIQGVRFRDAYDLKATGGAVIPANLHKYDIELQAGAGANILAVNNVLRGHATAPLLNQATGANVVTSPNY